MDRRGVTRMDALDGWGGAMIRNGFVLITCIVACLLAAAVARGSDFQPILSGTFHGDFYDIFALRDGQHVWGVHGGVVERSLDGGQSWESAEITLGQADGLMVVHFLDADEGWVAAGYSGRVFHSTDGGLGWTELAGTGIWMEDLFFFDTLHGWGVGEYAIARTEDGGQTWSTDYDMIYGVPTNVVFLSALEGWTAGFGKIWHTVDGGATWDQQFVGASAGFQGIAMSDPLHGCAVGAYDGMFTCYHTDDGGLNWLPYAPGTAWKGAKDVSLAPDGHGWAVGIDGLLLRTDDAGLTWQADDSGMNNTLLTVCARPGFALAAGLGGAVLTHVESSPGWNRIVELSNTIFSVAAWDDQRVLMVGGAGRLLRTDDAGDSWHEGWLGQGEILELRSVDAIAPAFAWTAGAGGGSVWRSEDGGASWQPGTPIEGQINEVDFVDADHGWCITLTGGIGQGHVWHTTDGGVSWTEQPGGVGFSAWTSLTALDLQHVWVGGWEPGSSVVKRSCDGGLTWDHLVLPTGDVPYALLFSSAEVGYCGTDAGTVFATFDGGDTWSPIHQAEPGVAWLDLALIGDWGLAVCGARLGDSWQTTGLVDATQLFEPHSVSPYPWVRDLESPGSHLLSLAFVSSWTGMAAGVWGEAFTGSPPVSAPDVTAPPPPARLAATPNPFNPRTSLRFSLQTADRATLTVHDVLGRRLRTLLADQPMAAGEHHVSWDGRDGFDRPVASGLYFARIVAGQVVQTVKLVLLE